MPVQISSKLKTANYNIRLTDEDSELLASYTTRDNNRSLGTANLLTIITSIEAQGMAEIQGKFTHNEWAFLAEMLQYAPIDEVQITKTEELIRRVISFRAFKLRIKYNIELKAFMEKVNSLNGMQTYAVFRRVQDFWRFYEDGTDFKDALYDFGDY